MSYNNDFYKLYEEYLWEPDVRVAHENMFNIFDSLTQPDEKYVVDLGCGIHQEYKKYGYHSDYFGFDLNAHDWRFRKNYRDLATIKEMDRLGPNCFVSLFSSEITAPFHTNMKFYHSLFEHIPSLKFGLVSGFYYYRQKNKNPILEAGGVISYQTLLPLENGLSKIFNEIRFEVAVSSKLFGDDVVEVWRFFSRK